jgi:hypothetical protein
VAAIPSRVDIDTRSVGPIYSGDAFGTETLRSIAFEDLVWTDVKSKPVCRDSGGRRSIRNLQSPEMRKRKSDRMQCPEARLINLNVKATDRNALTLKKDFRIQRTESSNKSSTRFGQRTDQRCFVAGPERKHQNNREVMIKHQELYRFPRRAGSYRDCGIHWKFILSISPPTKRNLKSVER